MVGKSRRASLNYIKDRVWGKLQGWKEKLLSQASKEVILKAVLPLQLGASNYHLAFVGI